jgi:hypothetical protein
MRLETGGVFARIRVILRVKMYVKAGEEYVNGQMENAFRRHRITSDIQLTDVHQRQVPQFTVQLNHQR